MEGGVVTGDKSGGNGGKSNGVSTGGGGKGVKTGGTGGKMEPLRTRGGCVGEGLQRNRCRSSSDSSASLCMTNI